MLLLVQLKDGQQHSAILRPASPEFTISAEASKWNIAADYGRMGTINILEGVDHLFFVLALLLIVSGMGPLFKAVGLLAEEVRLEVPLLQIEQVLRWI